MQRIATLAKTALSLRATQMRALQSFSRAGHQQAAGLHCYARLPERVGRVGICKSANGHWRMSKRTQLRSLSVVNAAATAEAPQTEEITYQAEVDRMMDLIVNSLYSNKEVFLRELVSNASDALDKARFLGLTDKDALADEQTLEIRIKSDKDAGTITIEDTGIGMTREELISSLGTIARSGTRKFAQMVKDKQDSANLIGQFGVGFYSAFLVAERVVVQSKSKDDGQYRWESAAGAHSYKVTAENEGDLKRGTRITLFLKEDSKELADDKKVGSLIKQYSEFIQFPIQLWNSQVKNEQVVDEEATQKKRQEAIEAAKSKGEDESQVQVEEVKKSQSTTEWDWQIQNNLKPIWARSPKEVTKEEYDSFFKATFKEFMEPIAYNHFNVEGTIEFSSILFCPSMAPFEETNLTQKLRNIRMYVKRVFISDEFDDNLMPRYLHFIKGIVDSSDLPLNISREILQESRVVRTIKKQLVKRSLELLEDLAKRPAKPAEENSGDSTSDYTVFFDAFGKYLKLGVLDDADNRERLSKLLRFPSSNGKEEMTSLDDYVSRSKSGQKDIYFLCAENRQVAENSPFVERLVRKGYEVIFGTEAIDEPCLGTIGQFDGKLLVDVSREGLDIDEEEDKQKIEAAKVELRELTEFMKSTLGTKVEKVEISSRLTDSPCAITTSKFGWSAAQERIMKSQAMGDVRAAEYMRGKKSLEINPDHPMINSLNANYRQDERNAKEIIKLMYETSLVTSGFDIESPKEFAARIYSMINLVTGDDAATSGSNGGKSSEVVEPEVMDPWKQ